MKLTYPNWLIVIYGVAFSAILSLAFVCFGLLAGQAERKESLRRARDISDAAAAENTGTAILEAAGIRVEHHTLAECAALPEEYTRASRGEEIAVYQPGFLTLLRPAATGGAVSVRVNYRPVAYADYFYFALACIAAGLGIVVIVSRRASRMLRALSVAIDRLARGEHPEDIASSDELGELASSFNQLKNRMVQSEETRAWFITSISHDLRTPLTSIKGFTKSLMDGLVKPENTRDALKIIDSEVGHMIRLTGDLMEVARMETGQLKLFEEYVNLSDLIGSVVETLGRKRQTLFDFDETVGALGDSGRLRQVFMNLIDNAYKYNRPSGKVFISVCERDGAAEISIRDTGIGIAPEDINHLFEKFYRADRSRTNTRDGSGIGLYVVKLLVEMHGGGIEVKSRLGEGSSFIVRLPAYTGEFADAGDEPENDGHTV